MVDCGWMWIALVYTMHMSKTFLKIIVITSIVFIVAACLIFLVRYFTGSGVSSTREDPVITILPDAGGDTFEIKNPSQLKNFTDVGADVYVSDERQLGQNVGFSVAYFKEDNSFAIAISGKPTDEYRKRASEYLVESLQISKEDACRLKVYVGVTFDDNPNLSGKNLGLSFCPGSVQL